MPIVDMVEKNSNISGAYLPFPLPREWIAQGATEPNFALRQSFHGCVISEREMNGYNDSDFYALVWDAEQNAFREIMFATTRGWCYPCFATSVDATPEVLERWQAYCKIAAAQASYFAEQRELRTPRVGKRIRVVAGRKIAKGTEWWVCDVQPDRFSKYGEMRIGLRNDTGERAWTAQRNVEVVQP